MESTASKTKRKNLMFNTYIHRRKSDGKVFYVGMGTLHRMSNMSMRSVEWHEMAKEGRTVELVANWDTKEEAFNHEKLLISCFKDMGHPLVNKTTGGAGNDGARSYELRKSHGKKMIGNTYRLGILHDDATKAKMSAIRKNVPKPKIMCLECGKVVGGHSNVIKHQKTAGHAGTTIF
jgi:hypothetical protein